MVQMGICYAFFGFTYAMLKFSINLPRPYCSLPSDQFITIMNVNHARCLSSFPSSHVGLALMMTIFGWNYMNKWGCAGAMLTVALVALSRITLAMHYPADIIYSMLITALAFGVSQLIFSIFSDNLIGFFREKLRPK